VSIKHLPGVTEENNKECRKYSSCAGRARSLISSQYKPKILSLQPRFLYRCKVLTVKTYFIISLHKQMDTYIIDGLQQLCDKIMRPILSKQGNRFCNIHLTLRRLMSYIYGAPILDVSRSHTTTQHSR